jgi:hypothetical protein
MLTYLRMASILLFLATGLADQTCQNGYAFGSTLGAFDGVAAFSNCTSGTISNQFNCEASPASGAAQPSCSASSATYIGEMWQCVEFVRRYYLAIYGLNLAAFRQYASDANTWYANASHLNL